MIESLRSFGYTLEAAVADIVDNSISAGAKNVWITFTWAGRQSTITILDDGSGMDEATLVEAMRPGSKNPLDRRHPEDLGRFGLGLKTASFSQCRRLTVASKEKRGDIFSRAWDLDHVGRTGKWELRTSPTEDAAPFVSPLEDMTQGTVVVWTNLDRIVDDAPSEDPRARDNFLVKVQICEQHLAMTFHRFLAEKRGLKLWINNNRVEPWDPFLTDQPATEELSKEALKIVGKSFHVVPYVLPHKSHLTDEVHARAAGPKGWNGQQGFYVYRNRRLLVAGSWLGLGYRQEEHYKLARILVDIPNHMDDQWQLDVRKAHAIPPSALWEDLKRIALVARRRASDIYRHRGKVVRRRHAQEFQLVWEKRVRHNRIFYKINRKHPLIEQLLQNSGAGRRIAAATLEMLENTVPLTTIAMEVAERQDDVGGDPEWGNPKTWEEMAIDLYTAFRKDGLTKDRAFERVASVEPFDNLPNIIAKLEKHMEET